MGNSDDGLKTVHLQLPARDEEIARLELGSAVYLTGTIYTAREGVYKRVLEDGVTPPVDLRAVSNANFHCSPAAAPDNHGGYNVGAVTATASFRFSKWMKAWLELSDLQGNSLFEQHNAQINANIEALYAGLKKPALHRYGETDDRKDELM